MDEIRKDDFILGDANKFGKEQVEIALADMRDYFAGKASIDEKATANEEWWRLRHWNVLADNNEGSRAGVEVGSAWLVNSLLNKHADIMDSFPKPNILPREADDEVEAKILSNIMPTIMEHNDYEKVYRQKAYDFCKDGGAITSVLWDSTKHDGMGDIAITNVDVHNIAWQPGIEDIQDSDKVYFVTLEDVDVARAKWPKIADKIGPEDTGMITKYIHDDNIDTSNTVQVVDMYYKKPTLVPVYMDGEDEEGNPTQVKVYDIPKMVLHLAIIVGDQLAFCSENEEGYENGFYEHGRYPFVFVNMFPIKDSPWSFGYLDLMKNSQRDIDRLDQAIIKNAMMRAKPRYWIKKNGNISPDKFADWNNELVEVAGGDLGDSVRRIEVDDVPSGAMAHLSNKIEELKETSGNRDFNQGGVSGGITAASAVAALQEAGSKLSRDLNKELYRGAREEYYLVIELIRQFYTEPRSFRVDARAAEAFGTPDQHKGYEVVGAGNDYRFIQYSNAGIVSQDTMMPDGTVRHRRPMFDILVTAEKQSPFNRAAQNETIKELYGMGLFQPENAVPALVCLDGMDFEGKDKIRQQIEQNSIFEQQYQAAMKLIQNQAMIDPAFGAMAMQAGVIDPEQMMAMGGQQPTARQQSSAGGTPEERAARATEGGDNSQASKARLRAAQSAVPR